MKRFELFFILLLILSVTSCSIFEPQGVEVNERILLTGECLTSTELIYNHLDDDKDHLVRDNHFIFCFTLDVADVEKKTNQLLWPNTYDIKPAKRLYNLFGQNKKKVEERFNSLFDGFSETYKSDWKSGSFDVTTILYNGGISLIADKEFAGFSPGENLSELIKCAPLYDSYVEGGVADPVLSHVANLKENAGKYLDIPLDYHSLIGTSIEFSVPMNDFKLSDETVKFELEIPVKTVMYLNWLNNNISSPDASPAYKEEVLHCKFITRYGLR